MSQIKAKQLKFGAAGDLLIGGAQGNGTTIGTAGHTDKVLRVVSGVPAWSTNDNIKSANRHNSVVASDQGIALGVQDSKGETQVPLALFKSGPTTDESFEFSSTTGALTIRALGTAADVDLILAPQGDGDVVIGNPGGAALQADTGENLLLKGGQGAGNLLINGGGTGKVFYSDSATDAKREVATLGVVEQATQEAKVSQARKQFAGNQTFALEEKTIPASIIAHVNGLVIKDTVYAYNSETHVLTFGSLGYELDSADQVVVTYEVTA